MKSRIASVLGLLGMLAVLMFGAAGTAGATTNPDYSCVNGLLVQICDNDVDIPVDIDVVITSNEILDSADIEVLETTLKDISDIDVTKNDIKVAVLSLYDNEFDIDILSDNVVVIGDLPCGC